MRLREEWRAVQAGLDSSGAAAVEARAVQGRLRRRGELLCGQGAALIGRRKKAMLRCAGG